ncbi:unnamed protein product, partial [Amoebophrya sp. A120]|eukprot:GSA120T00009832001.1
MVPAGAIVDGFYSSSSERAFLDGTHDSSGPIPDSDHSAFPTSGETTLSAANSPGDVLGLTWPLN